MFWGFLAVPLLMTIAAIFLASTPLRTGPALDQLQVHPIRSGMRALAIAGNPMAQLLFAIGAAAIFGVEYRYQSWRHIVPRASRSALLGAKIVVLFSFSAAALALLAVGDLLSNLILPLVAGVRMSDLPTIGFLNWLLTFGTSLLELLALGGTVALITVITRSSTTAIVAAFLLSMAASALGLFLERQGPPFLLPVPTLAADALRYWIWSFDSSSPLRPIVALSMLVAWPLATYSAALLIFSKQDLSTE
jgi:ABC-2 type transport system permease protein